MRRFLVPISMVAILSIGCDGSDTYIAETVPVSGIVTYEGNPLPAGYQVMFMPMGGVRAAIGVTDDQGRFTLGTNDAKDGAPVGKHEVAINYSPEIPGEPGKEDLSRPTPQPPVKLPSKYSDPRKSGLKVEVPPEGLQDYKIDLKE